MGKKKEDKPAESRPQASSSKTIFESPGSCKNAKQRTALRSALRQEMRRQGVERASSRFASTAEPPPPICNRVATPWHEPEQSCECHRWPQWIEKHAPSNKVEPITEVTDNEHVKGRLKEGDRCSYWRPGKKGKKWWYNGKVKGAWRVQFPRGTRQIVGLN